MMLEQGQYINDGERSLLVCSVKQINDIWYVYLLDEEKTEFSFYRVDVDESNHNFTEIVDEKELDKLIREFASLLAKEDFE